MLPVQDAMPSRTTPWVTIGFIALITAVLGLELTRSVPSARGLILSYGLVPAHLSPVTVLTAPFLHHGLFDAVLQCIVLWVFGDTVEDRLGRVRYLLLFIGGAALSGLAAVAASHASVLPIVGAAGGTGAIVGAHLVLFRQARVLMLVPTGRDIDLVEIPAADVAIAWLVLTALVAGALTTTAGRPAAPLMPVVGLLIGAALGRVLARPERLRCAWWNVPAS